jgi:hypothetical protein
MFIEAIAIGLIIGIVRNGRVRNLLEIELTGVSLVVAAIVLQILPIILEPFLHSQTWLTFLPFAGYLVMMAAVVKNRKSKGFYIILLGALLNMAVMLISGFKMPVTEAALTRAGLESLLETIQDGSVINYMLVSSTDGLQYFLGKLIALPPIYPLTRIFSIGDFLIGAGLTYFIQDSMLAHRFRRQSGMVRYRY